MDAYIGEIRMFAGNYAPEGWYACDGQLLSISQNQALFSLLGTVYGGDGTTNFALPDLRGRLPMHGSQTFGQKLGTESVTLTQNQVPAHGHGVRVVDGNATDLDPTGRLLANSVAPPQMYTLPSQGTPAALAAGAIAPNAGSAPHSNMMPSLCLNFIICANGEYPQRA